MRSRPATLLVFLLAACHDAPHAPVDSPNGCEIPEHAEWVATTTGECGIAPGADGGISIQLCHWVLALEPDGTGTWSYSDVTQGFTYSCSGVELDLSINGGASTATYDPSSGRLTYGEHEYCPADAAGCPPG